MDNETIDLFVPGRLCLFGEHSDWAGTSRTVNSEITPGCAIVTGTQQGIYARAKRSDMFSVTSKIKELRIREDISAMLPASHPICANGIT